MWVLFTSASPHKKRARWLAIAWTLLIFILCLLPGNELPKVNVPFIDKWAHVVLFAGFSFLWLCAGPTGRLTNLFILLVVSIFVGWLVEYIQGAFVPGRYQDDMDILADAAGGLAGILLFVLFYYIARNKTV
ncbi:MAG: VanZ family protein [Taibaiella sp.]|nr:VanZ family protein [Taibaiella sp.]